MVEHRYNPTRDDSAGQDAGPGERVAKALARAGVASRREIERLIEAGRVSLNGQVLDTPAVKVRPGDILMVDGEVIDEPEPVRVWRYHKPVGLLTSHGDPKGRPTVFENLPPGLPRVISIGRLDINSEGLLILTNDGELARALELPATGVVRQYRARARGRVTQERLDSLKDGITVEGVRYGPIEARLDKVKEGGTGANLWITVTLTEGKNREVRKVLEALGVTVNRLIRLAYGPFQLGVLEPGEAEEVGPRVIREQLAAYIPPEKLPTGSRTLTPAPKSATKPKAKPQREAPIVERPDKPVYKTGWAKPKKKPQTGGKVRFKPRAEPTVISAKPLPARGERPAAADTAKPKGKPPARAGKPGPRPQGRPGAKPPGKPGGKPFGGGPPRGRR